MLDKIKNRKESGFTIVEVMIVLAIAGLVILIVFLAVPALQRNARNTERNTDASLIGAGVNECLSNRNGRQASCTWASPGLQDYIDPTKLRQLQTVAVGNAVPGNTTTANIAFGYKCNADGSAPAAGNARAVALLFNTENTTGGNVPRCQEL